MAEIRPNVWLLGDVEHRDFAESVALLRSTADLHPAPPELIVIAQSRPGTMRRLEFERLRRSAPLAGIVTLCGSWCEGETRTGRPLSGTHRLYWYEFPNWWRRQLGLRADGKCPEWARGDELRLGTAKLESVEGGRVAVAADNWETLAAIADVLETARLKTDWIRPGRIESLGHNLRAAIWDGGQLNDDEWKHLTAFCRWANSAGVPVIALLDFPRHDRCAAARLAGAAAVLGKPWLNADVVASLRNVINANCMGAWAA